MATQSRKSSQDSSAMDLFPERVPAITLYFLQCSRAIRIAWLLEALGLPYTVKFYERKANYAVPDNFLEESGSMLGKSPVLKDGDLVIEESGAITEYVDYIHCVPQAETPGANEMADTSLRPTTSWASWFQRSLHSALR